MSRKAHIVISPEGKILDCFSSDEKAQDFKNKWHKENFVKPTVVEMKIK